MTQESHASIDNWKMRTRKGWPRMYRGMFEALLALRAAKANDSPFIHLPGFDSRTLHSLVANDWIFASPGLDGVRYTITTRGLKALAVYETPKRRSDGLCPRCGDAPRPVDENGRRKPYCVPCGQETDRERHKRAGNQYRADKPCSRCKSAARHITASGHVTHYCQECRRELRKEERKRKRARLLERIQAGEHIPCIKPGCNDPRHVRGRSVYDYCTYHFNQMHRKSYLRRGLKKAMQKQSLEKQS